MQSGRTGHSEGCFPVAESPAMKINISAFSWHFVLIVTWMHFSICLATGDNCVSVRWSQRGFLSHFCGSCLDHLRPLNLLWAQWALSDLPFCEEPCSRANAHNLLSLKTSVGIIFSFLHFVLAINPLYVSFKKIPPQTNTKRKKQVKLLWLLIAY